MSLTEDKKELIEEEEIPQIELPFEPRRFDFGEWIYDHQAGIYATLALYILIAIGFVTAKITIEIQPHSNGITIDLEQIAELERQKEELEQSIKEQQQLPPPLDWSSVQNRASNESATNPAESASRQDNELDELFKRAEESRARMEANRASYEQGVAEARAIKERPATGESSIGESQASGEGNGGSEKSGKVEGNVSVSYSFTNPVRHARRLVVPSYMCQGGGEVVIRVLIDRGGEVLSAKAISGGDECMQEAAAGSALKSLFDISKDAPALQMGTITYIFIPQ